MSEIDISSLPVNFHGSGSLHESVLKALCELPPARFSVETGTGKSTLIFSHKSERHIVFTQDDRGNGDSLERVRGSELLGPKVEFVIGPTQLTLGHYHFEQPIDSVFLDGPHAYPFPELEYYFLYPHIAVGGWLIIDDIHIPTITHLVEFLKDDAMFSLRKVVKTTAFFQRTNAPLFDPLGDSWNEQGFNKRRFPNLAFSRVSPLEHIKHRLPIAWRQRIKGRTKALLTRVVSLD